MAHLPRISVALLTVIVVAIGGCGPATGTVSGTVTVDGKPAASGVISFVPAEGAGAPVTVDIQGGAYTAQAVAGSKRVQISVPVVTGQRKEYNGPDAPLVDITEESVPAKYNSETELTFELKRGANTKDWVLEGLKTK
ncbi:MAG TPA: hypothetical protein VGI40_11935 [Pirellulaceae bacterium]|jgi:hypothetical protein